MYFDFLVDIPDRGSKIIMKPKGSTTYVLYQYGQRYESEKGYEIPKRSIIGKLDSKNSQQMYPNENFQIYFPNASMPEERPSAYRSCSLRIGSYIIIRKTLEEYKLPKLLKKHVGDDYQLFMDLIAYLIINEDNAGQYYPDYAYCHPLFSPDMKIYSDSKVSRLLSSITPDQIIGFQNDWNKGRDKKQRIYISYDSTNKNCQSGDIDILEHGAAKDDKKKTIFNLSIAFDKNGKVPLLYEEYPGSINDISQFRYMVDKVMSYGYKNIGFILDRGYFDQDNIEYMDKMGFSFIMMVKGCRKLVSSLIMEKRNTFETKRSCSIRAYKVYGTTEIAKLYAGDQKDRYFHIYYSPYRQAYEREKLEADLDRYKKDMDKAKETDLTFGDTYKKYFHLIYKDKKFVGYTEKEDVIEYDLETAGYFCIVTSENMTAEQALIQYKGRDISEKLFQADKSFIGSKSMRVHSKEALSAKIFLEFTALIVRNRIYNLLKETMLKLDSNPNYLTVPAAIRELEKLEMVRLNNGRYQLDHAITKRQRIILSSFGINDDKVKDAAGEISNILKNAKEPDMQADEEDENGENEIDYFD